LGYIFEEIVGEWLNWETNQKSDVIDHQVDQIGRWWYKETEIDLIAYSEENQTFIEVKWSTLSQRDAERILANQIHKSAKTDFGGKHQYMLICREYLDSKDALHQLKIFDGNDIMDRWIKRVE
jgi:AAA+ ATPase superfamily predicted ATPase